MDLEATISAKPLKHAINVLCRVRAEAAFEIGQNELICRLADPENALITQVTMPSDVFDLFSAGSVRWIGVNLKRMASALSRASVKDDIHISGADDALYFTRGIHQRKLTSLDLAHIPEALPLPELTHSVRMSLSGKEFREIVAEANGVVAEALRITARFEGGVVFDAVSIGEDGYRGELDAGRLTVQTGIDTVQAMYSLDYLLDIAVDTRATDAVSWCFGVDMPCEIRYERDGVEILYMLAPRIESM